MLFIILPLSMPHHDTSRSRGLQKQSISFPLLQNEANLVLHPKVLYFCLAEIPENQYIKYFAPGYSLKIPSGPMVCETFHM